MAPALRKETAAQIVREVKSLKEIQRRMAGRLPQWKELEGTADELAEVETRGHK